MTFSFKKLFLVCITLGFVGYLWIRVVEAIENAERSSAYGRFGQMSLVLRSYESKHGSLPPLYLKDSAGKPIQSWRSLILAELDPDLAKAFDLSQEWNSAENTKYFDAIDPDRWSWFARHPREMKSPVVTYIFGYLGPESIWDGKTGLPKGKTHEMPDRILLLSVPESDCHPLRPFDLTEEELRQRLKEGQDVLFLMSGEGYRYGRVSLENGEIKFKLLR